MKHVILLMLICTYVSCGIKKENLNEQKNIHEEQVLNLIESSFVGLTIQDSIGAKLKREKIYKITTLSKPDSSGLQYPVSVEEGTVIDDFKGDRLKISDSTALNNIEKSKNNSKNDKSKKEYKTTKDNRLIPFWGWWLIIGGVMASLLAWLARKKK